MTAARKPDPVERSIEALVREHGRKADEPLHLAVQFRDPRHPKDVILLEVIGGFGGGHIDPDRRFLEVTMSASSAVEIEPGGELRFVFTSPEELNVASAKNWAALKKLKKLQLVKVHHADKVGAQLQPFVVASS